MLLETGLPESFVKLMGRHWKKQVVYTKLAGHFSCRPFVPKNGIPQGCSISLVATLILTTMWAGFITSVIEGLRTSRFVDDISLRNVSVLGARMGVTITKTFQTHSGHCINLAKSAIFESYAKERERGAGGQIEGRSQVQRSGQEWEEVPSSDHH